MKKIRLVGVIILCSIFLGVLIMGLHQRNNTDKDIIKGQIFIERIEDNYAIALDGEWEFYWDQLIPPENFNGVKDDNIDYFQVPQLWMGSTYGNIPLESMGVATYRMVFDIKMQDQVQNDVLGIKMPYVYSAYRLWLNGNMISYNGEVGLNSTEETVTRSPEVIVISPLDGKNEIVLQISNHHFYRGGISKSILLGTADYLFSIREKQIALDIFMAGSFFVMSVMFFLLYFIRMKEKGILYFSLVCFFVFTRTLISNEVYISQIFNNFNWGIGNRIEASFSYVGMPLMILLLGELYKKYFVLKFLNLWKIFSVVGLVFVSLFPHVFYDSPLIYVNLIQAIYVIYIFITFIKYFDKSIIDFYVLIIGKFIVSIYAIHDIIITYNIMGGSLKFQIGMYIFIFSLGYALILLLYREFGRVESLVFQNESMLIQISQMNQDLEQLVEKRTEELEISNKQLLEISRVDGLTGIPNRLSLDYKLNSFLEQAVEKSQPITILFLDIDFFKIYNDNYGHIQGDNALRNIAQALFKEIKNEENAFIARFGGEEFVLLYLNMDFEETYNKAEKLRIFVSELKIPHEYSMVSDFITISIGGISLIPTKEDKATTLLDRADKALYRAKEAGRNKTYMWDDQ